MLTGERERERENCGKVIVVIQTCQEDDVYAYADSL